MWHCLLICLFVAPAFNQQHGDLRLTGYGSNLIAGRLEIYFNNEWGTICGDIKFNTVTASVACRQLGFGPAITVIFYPDLRFGVGDGDIKIGKVVCTGEESHILRCNYKLASQLPECAHYNDIGILCSNVLLPYSGAVKLTNSLYSSNGMLQLYLYGQWRTVCSVNFDTLAVNSVCRHLGYTHAVSFNESLLINTTTWVVSPSCIVNSTCLKTCNTTLPRNEVLACPSFAALNVECGFNTTLSDISPSGNRSNCEMAALAPYFGEVIITVQSGLQNVPKIYIGDAWRMVCFDEYFTYANADVLCKQVGYSFAVRYTICSAFLDGVLISCSGFERSILMCPLVNVSLCSKFVSLKCNNEDPSFGSLKLVNSAGSAGSLRIFDGNHFNPICDVQFGINELKVACRQLGYSNGIQIIKNSMHEKVATSTPYQYKFFCTGEENYLIQCKTVLYDVSSVCRFPYDAVGVHCGAVSVTSLRIKGNNGFGRLEVKIGAEWGTVCGIHFNQLSAHVACRQLGYKTSVGFLYMNNVNLPILLTSVQCSGFESDILSCSHAVADNGTCHHNHDVYLNCSKDQPVQDGKVRLVSMEGKAWSGHLEISYHGLWMTICGKFFSRIAADVACRELGYLSAESYCTHLCNISSNNFIFFAEFHCSGNESRLIECEQEVHNRNFCSHEFDVQVTCSKRTILVTSTVNEPYTTAMIPNLTPNIIFLPIIVYGSAGGIVVCILLSICVSFVCCCICHKKKREAPVSQSDARTIDNIYDYPDCNNSNLSSDTANKIQTAAETCHSSPMTLESSELEFERPPLYDEVVCKDFFVVKSSTGETANDM